MVLLDKLHLAKMAAECDRRKKQVRKWVRSLFAANKLGQGIGFVEPLEVRQCLSAGTVPVDVVVFGGTAISPESILLGEGGHKLDPAVQQIAYTAFRAAKAWNPASRVQLMQWGTIGDATKQGHDAAVHEEQLLAQDPQQRDMLVVGYSRGTYPADEMIKEVVRTSPNIRHIEFIMLDPTGIKAKGDGQLQPLEWGGRVHTVVYHDGYHAFNSHLVVDEYPLPGENHLVHPSSSSDGTASHVAFATWETQGGGQSPLVNDFLKFVNADSYTSGKVRQAASVFGQPAGFPAPFYIAGSGPGLVLPILEDALKQGLKQVWDDMGNTVGISADKVGSLLVTTLESPGKYLTTPFSAAGAMGKSIEHSAGSLIQAVDDTLKGLNKLFPWNW